MYLVKLWYPRVARALTLEGAVDGLLQLALPDWDKLQDPFVSIDVHSNFQESYLCEKKKLKNAPTGGYALTLRKQLQYLFFVLLFSTCIIDIAILQNLLYWNIEDFQEPISASELYDIVFSLTFILHYSCSYSVLTRNVYHLWHKENIHLYMTDLQSLGSWPWNRSDPTL